MGGQKHVDNDVEIALQLRGELIEKAIELSKEDRLDDGYIKAFQAMRTNRIYVWEPPAIEAFWRFWDNKSNYSRFMKDFFRHSGLIYREEMVGSDFHFFPAPGRLFGGEGLPDEFDDPAASIIFPPTTRVIGTGMCKVGGTDRITGLIQTIHIDPQKLTPTHSGMMRLDRMTSLPPLGTLESSRLMLTVETRFPKILGGIVADRKPINWLICLYQLQIFLVQPFVGHTKSRRNVPKKGKFEPQPAPEVVQVLMREPLKAKIPHYIFPTIHPVTGRKLEFEVDVRAHERHCASGVVALVRAHKRGPTGKSREKVIKVIR